MSKFTTTLEAVSSNKSKTTIKLSMSNTVARQFSSLYLNSIDKELVVSFEDPQGEMEITQDQHGRPSLVATADGSGVIHSVRREDDAEGEQHEMDLEPDEAMEIGLDADGDAGDEAEDGDTDPIEEDETVFDETAEEEEIPIDKEELETFILEERPTFTGIVFDFPTLLERKRQGETWMAMARELNVPSTKLQAAWSQYKRRTSVLLQNNA